MGEPRGGGEGGFGGYATASLAVGASSASGETVAFLTVARGSHVTLRCEILPLDSFDRLIPEWDHLSKRYRQAPFLASDCVSALLEYFAQGGERIVRVVDDAGLAAIGVFGRRRGLWETFQPSQSPIGCLVTREGLALPELLAAIGRSLPGLALGVAATQQDPLLCERPADGGRIGTLDYITTAWVEVAGSFEDYWNARGKNLRQNLRKQRRKLADDGVVATLEVIDTPEGVSEGVADYAALESAGWKASGGTAVSIDNDQGRFYVRMLSAFCARGRGKICRYRFGDKVVAVDLCIESDEALVVLKTTYDESIRAFSPAALMREELFRQWWEEGRLRRIEFYGRMMEWHTRWTDRSRTLYHVNWYRWPGLMRVASRVAKRVQSRSAAPAAAPVETN
jgi:hypothetical protein